jgi:hypothetical protein
MLVATEARRSRGRAAQIKVGHLKCGDLGVVILSFGTFEKVKLYKPGTLSRRPSRDIQTCSNAASDPLATRKRFIAINIKALPLSMAAIRVLFCDPADRQEVQDQVEHIGDP